SARIRKGQDRYRVNRSAGGGSGRAKEPVTNGGDNDNDRRQCQDQLLFVTLCQADRQNRVRTVFWLRLPHRLLQVRSSGEACWRRAARIRVALQACQVGPQIRRALVSKIAVFLQRLTNNVF